MLSTRCKLPAAPLEYTRRPERALQARVRCSSMPSQILDIPRGEPLPASKPSCEDPAFIAAGPLESARSALTHPGLRQCQWLSVGGVNMSIQGSAEFLQHAWI